ncbi:MAG TPA: hypothetical protein VGS19_35770 [Streptosporangiaceae bacterium]|nr:hypothetical protein [Streptosporangiaceae bacterium]
MRRGVLVAGFTLAAMVALPAAADASVTWSTSFSGPSGYEVAGFAARSAVDVWAVGLRPGGRCQYRTLTQHWDGSAWTVVPSPSDTAVNSVLDGVTVAGTKQAWAVGTMGCPADQSRTLTEHWNGSRWSIVSSPNGGVPGNPFSTLQAVAAVSPANVWAVGAQAGIRNQAPVSVPLIEHWDGTNWSIVPVPQAALGVLESVSAASASDVWAVGGGQQSGQSTVALHFNGSSWQLVTAPTPPSTTGGLSSVKALSPTSAWAVGESFPAAGGSGKILTDHWNGTTWQVVTAPPVGGPTALSALSAVGAAPTTGVWAVGSWVTGTAGNSVVLHWTGTAWQQEPAPSASDLFSVAVLPNNELFAADQGTIFLGQPSG